MNRSNIFLLTLAVALYFGGIPAFAQYRPGGGGGGGFGMPRTPGGEKGRRERKSKDDSSTADKSTVGNMLTQNTKLASDLQGLLPAGTNLQDAAKGFERLGQFVAAVHVSHDLGIPFDQLKAKLVGTSAMSLDKAIEELKPEANAREEAIKANEQALVDMEKSLALGKSAAVGRGPSPAVTGN